MIEEYITGALQESDPLHRRKVLTARPEEPITRILQYQTDVLRSYDGTEQRVSVLGNRPRQSLRMDYRFTEEGETERTRRTLAANLAKDDGGAESIWVPLWEQTIEARFTSRANNITTLLPTSHYNTLPWFFTSDAANTSDAYRIVMDFLVEGINGRILRGLVRQTGNFPINLLIYRRIITRHSVFAIDPSVEQIDRLGETFQVTPLLETRLSDSPTQKFYRVNASEISLEADAVDLNCACFFPANANEFGDPPRLPEGLYRQGEEIILNQAPLAEGQVEEISSIQFTNLDYGAKFLRTSGADYPNRTRPLRFRIKGQEELVTWGFLLDELQGMKNEFWMPTYLNELEIITKPGRLAAVAQPHPEASHEGALTSDDLNESRFRFQCRVRFPTSLTSMSGTLFEYGRFWMGLHSGGGGGDGDGLLVSARRSTPFTVISLAALTPYLDGELHKIEWSFQTQVNPQTSSFHAYFMQVWVDEVLLYDGGGGGGSSSGGSSGFINADRIPFHGDYGYLRLSSDDGGVPDPSRSTRGRPWPTPADASPLEIYVGDAPRNLIKASPAADAWYNAGSPTKGLHAQSNNEVLLPSALSGVIRDIDGNYATALPDSPISLVEKCRLGSDEIRFTHYSTYSEVALTVETLL